jgi:hypothetical protein
MDAKAIAVASLGQMKVIKVNYRRGGPSIAGNEDIFAVYRELLKTYKPKSIAMFGASGGCTLDTSAATGLVVWRNWWFSSPRFHRGSFDRRVSGLNARLSGRKP